MNRSGRKSKRRMPARATNEVAQERTADPNDRVDRASITVFSARVPNKLLQQTSHANNGFSMFSALSRVSRLLSGAFGRRGPRDVKVALSQPRRDPHARRYRGP